VEPHSASTDNELHDWLIWAREHGTSFLHAIAEAAFLSDLKHYRLLRPILLNLKKMVSRELVIVAAAAQCETPTRSGIISPTGAIDFRGDCSFGVVRGDTIPSRREE
jgi:hypothetical protein